MVRLELEIKLEPLLLPSAPTTPSHFLDLT